MELNYLCRAAIPSRYGHVNHILNIIDAFLDHTDNVRLIHPRHVKEEEINESLQSYYGLKHSFPNVDLPCLDLQWLKKYSENAWYFTYSVTFCLLTLFYLYSLQIKSDSKQILYSRDQITLFVLLLLKPLFDYELYFEVHRVPTSFRNPLNRIWKQLDGIVVVTNYIKEQFVEQGFDDSDILVAPDAVDLKKFDLNINQREARREVDFPTDQTICTYMGRFHTLGEEKGIRDIILASGELIAQYENLSFYFIGGPLDYAQKYHQLIEQNELPQNRFNFLDFQPPTEIPYFLKASDILLMPFPWSEHYAYNMSPLKMFEYMASKRPIVATNLPSVQEILTHRDNALLAEPGNPQSLRQTITELLGNQSLREKIANQAFEDAKQYTWDQRAQGILDFINEQRTNSQSGF